MRLKRLDAQKILRPMLTETAVRPERSDFFT
jgi:hypothetical protein